jgi:hypothetical protein
MLKLAAVAAIALVNSSAALGAAGGCHSFSGSYVQEFVPCAVPALACVDATLSGDLPGVSHTVITGFDPATRILTGDVTIVRKNGSIITATIETVRGSGLATEQITGGTRQFSGAGGFVVATGTSTGTYAGQYCLARGVEADDD